MSRKMLFLPLLCIVLFQSWAQSPFTVDYIMRDPRWMGTFPSAPFWSEDGKTIYFRYNLEKDPADSLYKIDLANPTQISKVQWSEEKDLRKDTPITNTSQTLRIYRDNKKIQLEDLKKQTTVTLLEWFEPVSNPQFQTNDQLISFVSGGNIYLFDRDSKNIKKVTNIINGTKPGNGSPSSSESKGPFLEEENLALLQVVRERKENQKLSREYRNSIRETKTEFAYYTGGKNPSGLQLSPDGNFATFSIFTPSSSKNTKVPDYTAASGYTEDLNARPKVGTSPSKVDIGIYDLIRDTVYFVQTSDLPGIKDLPDYVKDYPERKWEEKERDITLSNPIFLLTEIKLSCKYAPSTTKIDGS